MCGIVGILTAPTAQRSAAFEHNARRVRVMAHALRHRGPDGEGFVSDPGPAAGVHLGHRRLSILDPTPLGAQPMTDHSGRFTVSFNGAIYNFIELAEELRNLPGAHALRSHSDTEVLVLAWAAWGPACVPRFNGMFAFAIWDAQLRTLYLCRDRFGVKPLHYAWLGEGEDGVRLLFASEAKALFVHPALQPIINRRVMAEFLLSHSIDHDPEGSAYEGVQQVPQASILTIAPQARPALSRYWDLSPPESQESQEPLSDGLVRRTRELLTDAITLRLRSDVPLGGTLSGGLDSSLLTGIIAGPLYRLGRVVPPYRVFLSQFPGTAEDHKKDEAPWAEMMLASLPQEAVAPLRSSPDAAQMTQDLPHALYHQEEPFADSSILAHYALMRVVHHSGVKVIINGQGSDEVFGGYVSYYYTLLGDLIYKGRLREALTHARARSVIFGEPVLRLLTGGLYHAAPPWVRQQLFAARLRHAYPLSRAGWAASDSLRRYADHAPGERWGPLDRYLLDCIQRWVLPHILRQDDRNTMAFGIESRAPFLDYRLAEHCFRTAPTARLGAGHTKRLLREVSRGLMPEPVRLRADKMGFWSPQRDWLLANEPLVRDVAQSLPAEVAELTDGPGWASLLDRLYRQRDHGTTDAIWAGFLCSLWVTDTLPRLRRVTHGDPRA